jgi:hypothetical protein
MLRTVRLLSLLACVTVSLPACLKVKQRTVLMPDGSGKLTMSVAFGKQLLALAKAGNKEAKDPFANLENEMPAEDMQGVVAVTRPEKFDRDGFTGFTFSVYFEDANKLHFGAPKVGPTGPKSAKAKKEAMTFEFKKEGDGYVLVVDNGLLGGNEQLAKMSKDDPDVTPEMKDMAKKMMGPMLEGMEISEVYEMPGAVATAEGLAAKEGRTASMLIKGEEMLDTEKMKSAAGLASPRRRIVCGASALSEDDVKAFKAELAKAKEDWAKWKAEAQARKSEGAKKPETPAPAPPAGK